MNSITLADFMREWRSASPTVCVHTSGSTGKPKEMLVEKSRMLASARMTCDFLGLKEGDSALLCMSLDYIAGKMMVVRAVERGLRLIAVEPSGHPLADKEAVEDGNLDFAAMVPMQVWNTMQVPEERERLSHIRHLIIGGGAIDPQLEADLRQFPNHIWSSYGMTETLSHIALRDIHNEWYTPMSGISLSQDDDGCLVIDAPHLCDEPLHTHDIVAFHPTLGWKEGGFRVIGRRDNVICSGGIKIQIEEVEETLRPVFGDTIQVTSLPYPKFGEIVVYLTTRPIDEHLLRLCIPNPYWLPKRIIQVPQLPKTGTGKPDRGAAKRMASAAQSPSVSR